MISCVDFRVIVGVVYFGCVVLVAGVVYFGCGVVYLGCVVLVAGVVYFGCVVLVAGGVNLDCVGCCVVCLLCCLSAYRRAKVSLQSRLSCFARVTLTGKEADTKID